MAKINKKEYEYLKSLDDKWNWIARDELLLLFTNKPYKTDEWGMNIISNLDTYEELQESVTDDILFQFIQWEDEEPYHVQELIEEYEKEYHIKNAKIVNVDANKITGSVHQLNGSEETEVKKNIEWLREQIKNEMNGWNVSNPDYFRGAEDAYEDVKDWLKQLDEPEITEEQAWGIIKDIYGISNEAFVRSVMRLVMEHVKDDTTIGEIREKLESEALSQEWIDENSALGQFATSNVINFDKFVKADELENLLVPTLSNKKKVQLPQKTADELNRYKERGYSLKDLLVIAGSKQAQEKLARAWLDGYTVEEEQKYFAKIKGHENISSDDKYWNYCITDESLDIGDNKVHPDVLAEYVLSATKDEWANLGINEANADFVKVEELE